MYSLVQVCALVLVLSGGVYSRDCNDCVNYDRCKKALDLALYKKTPETVQLFKDASCGFDYSFKTPIVKVCCSVFSAPPTDEVKVVIEQKISEDAKEVEETPEDRRIASHKNLNLMPAECGNIKGDRIVGGSVAALYEFPWMALISHLTRDGMSFKCGGTIINKRYVLTAAHCVKNKTIAGVRVGEYDLDNDVDCQNGVCEKHIQDIPVEKSIIHERYKGLPMVINDIALLRLGEDVDFNHKNVHWICLPITSELRHQPLSNKMATVTGWGITEEQQASAILRKVRIPIHTAEQCSGLYNRFSRPGEPDVTADQLCAGTLKKDSCNGDSGGPLMLEEKYNNVDRYVQYGVVSHGPLNCGSDYPGVYTDVTKYMGWILDKIAP